MEDLLKAITIFLKYGDPHNPTHCEHDRLTVCIDPELVSEDDLITLDELGFYTDDEGGFYSYRFGSA